jgi:hypothetical protein
MKAYIVDGPERGRVLDAPGGATVYHVMHALVEPSVWLYGATEATPGAMRTGVLVYHLHQYVIMERVYMIWSLGRGHLDVDEYDVLMAFIDAHPNDLKECRRG